MDRTDSIKGLKGLATGIGSLPHLDPEAALDLIFKHAADIPFWPQLPRRDVREGMVAQFSENLPCLELTSGGLRFVPGQKEKELETFYEKIIGQDIGYFKISREYARGLYAFHDRLEKMDLKGTGFIKCHICGPFTFAAAINDDRGVSLLYDPVFAQAVLKGLTMKAVWQIELFRKFGKKIILFLDEPYLGCFGSAYTPINRQDVVRGLSELTAGIKSEDVLVGVHCCGNTDWSMFAEIETIDIISFDAFAFLDRVILYAESLGSFLKRGGMLCWGIIPTQDFTGRQEARELADKISGGINALAKKGLDRELLLKDLFLSPSCGLGNLDVKAAEGIFRLLSETCSVVRKAL